MVPDDDVLATLLLDPTATVAEAEQLAAAMELLFEEDEDDREGLRELPGDAREVPSDAE